MLIKHCEEIEKKFAAFEAENKNQFLKFLELPVDSISSTKNDQIKYTKKEFAEKLYVWKKECEQFREILADYKANMHAKSLSALESQLKIVLNSTAKCSKLLQSSSNLFPNDMFFIEYNRKLFFLMKQDKTSLSKPLAEQIQSLIKADRMIINAGERGKDMKKIFHSLGRARKQVSAEIGKYQVNIHLRSSVNLARGKIEVTKDKYELLRDVVLSKCNQYLKSQSISDELESRILSIKALAESNNSYKLEQGLLDYFCRILIEFLAENTSLLRISRVNLFIELFHSNEYSGFMDETISSFSNIFMKVAIDVPLIEAYLLNKSVDRTTQFYESLIHEFSHSYDWILNARNDYMLAKNILGEEPTLSTVILARVIKSLRMEGLAGLNSLVKRGIENDGKLLLKINDLFETEFSDYITEVYSFFEDMYKKDGNYLKKKETEIYESGAVQYFGFYMTLIIFIKEFGANAKYFLHETPQGKVLLRSIKENFDHAKLLEKKEGIWLEWPKTGSVIEDAAKNPYKKMIFMVADKQTVLEFSHLLVQKLAIMPPNEFMRKFIESAKALGIAYGPMSENCIQQLNSEKKKQFDSF